MNKVLRDYIPHLTMPFLDDVPIKGCIEQEKNEEVKEDGCRVFVKEHIGDCEKILTRLEEVNLTLSGPKSVFGVNEVLIVGHMCGFYGRRPPPSKVDAIEKIVEICSSVSEVRRFLGACVFYIIWIPHFPHIADVLYNLLRKRQKFFSTEQHTKAMRKLKHLLKSAPILRKADYEGGRPIVITVDTSPIGIGWAIGQDDEEGHRYAIWFGAKVLSG